MSTLTAAQIAGYATAAGWSGGDVATAVAVALAESSGRSDARGDVGLQDDTWGPSIGLWQVRSLRAQRGTGGPRDELANTDPAHCARSAHTIWAGSGWQAWTTYTTGAYRLFLPRATAGARSPATVAAAAVGAGTQDVAWQIPVPGLGSVTVPLPWQIVTGPAEAASNAAELLKNTFVYLVKVAAWISDRANWLRIAKVVGGVAIIGIGVTQLAAPTVTQMAAPAVTPVVEAAKKVALP